MNGAEQKSEAASGLFVGVVILGGIGMVFAIGYLFGERSVCSPELFPLGSVGQAIALCVDQGGSPNIDFRNRFTCTKRVEMEVKLP